MSERKLSQPVPLIIKPFLSDNIFITVWFKENGFVTVFSASVIDWIRLEQWSIGA